ncbi:hypothetical protein ACOMHN_030896 [Nucella lapillus]
MTSNLGVSHDLLEFSDSVNTPRHESVPGRLHRLSMEHYLPALCVCVWVLGIPTPTAAETDLYRFPTQVFEVALDPDSQILYVGGVNTVHQLTTNLTLLRNTTLSPCGQGVGCDSRVRVLEVDSVLQRLLACGTNGQCWLLGLDDLSKQPLPDGFVPQDVQNPHLTQVDHQSSGSLGTSQWMVASPNHVQNLPILSIKEIGKTKTDEFTWRYSSYKQTESAIRKSSGTFVYDVVDGFCFEKECFYLTLQQVNRTNHTLINRLANTCATSLFPYVEKGLDFVIVSSVYTQYSRTVGFTLGRIRDSKNNVFVIFVFMKPESPLDDRVDGSKGFVLGSVRLSEVQKSLGITRLLCTRDDVGNKVQVPDWYAGHFGSCCTNQSQFSPGLSKEAEREKTVQTELEGGRKRNERKGGEEEEDGSWVEEGQQTVCEGKAGGEFDSGSSHEIVLTRVNETLVAYNTNPSSSGGNGGSVIKQLVPALLLLL